MATERRVIFLGKDQSPYYLSGFRESKTHIRGYVENGAWSLIIDKLTCGEDWKVYSGTSHRKVTGQHPIGTVNPDTIKRVKIPDHVMGDYNVIINWARGALEEQDI